MPKSVIDWMRHQSQPTLSWVYSLGFWTVDNWNEDHVRELMWLDDVFTG